MSKAKPFDPSTVTLTDPQLETLRRCRLFGAPIVDPDEKWPTRTLAALQDKGLLDDRNRPTPEGDTLLRDRGAIA